MFKKKKQHKSQNKATPTKGLVENENGHFQLDETLIMRQHLKGAGKLIGDGELGKMVKLQMTADQINKRMQKRLIIVIMFFIIICAFSFFVKQYSAVIIMMAFIVAGVIWFVDIKGTDRYFVNYNIQRSIAWSSFVRMASGYLSELSNGVNMFSILKKIVPRMSTQEDRDNLNRLIIRMSDDPEDSQPFLDFAHSYSSSMRSEMIMLVIQDMYLGNISDENIQLLANDATKELTAQIKVITEHKLTKFRFTSIQFAMVGMIPMVAYVLAFVWSTLIAMFKGTGM